VNTDGDIRLMTPAEAHRHLSVARQRN